MSLAGIFGAVSGSEDKKFSPNTLINTDIVSVYLKEGSIVALVPAEAKKELKDSCRSVSVAQKETQARCIQLMVSTSAGGHLACVVVILKDSNYKKLKLVEVS